LIIEKEIKLLPRQVPSFTEKIIDKLKKFEIKENILFDLKLVLNEALINAVKHGNRLDKNKSVHLAIKKKDKRLEIWLEDQGKGFDYRNLKLPTDSANLAKQSGRGVFLIKEFADELKFFNRGRKLKMVKYLN